MSAGLARGRPLEPNAICAETANRRALCDDRELRTPLLLPPIVAASPALSEENTSMGGLPRLAPPVPPHLLCWAASRYRLSAGFEILTEAHKKKF